MTISDPHIFFDCACGVPVRRKTVVYGGVVYLAADGKAHYDHVDAAGRLHYSHAAPHVSCVVDAAGVVVDGP